MPFTTQPPPVPPANLVWVNERGELTPEAYAYLLRLIRHLAAVGAAIP